MRLCILLIGLAADRFVRGRWYAGLRWPGLRLSPYC
jgi:hypothetical protein